MEEINLMSEIVNTILENKDLTCLNYEELSKVTGGYLTSILKGAVMGTPIGGFKEGLDLTSTMAFRSPKEFPSEAKEIEENRQRFAEGAARVISSGLCVGLILAPASYKLGNWLRSNSKSSSTK